jgi:DNA repair protein SbcD/Mre11
VWYSGALEYASPHLWSELKREQELGLEGKGWLLADLESGKVTRHPVSPARRVIDLPRIEGAGCVAADLDAMVAKAVAAIPGGIADQIVRQVITNVPRHVGREMNHAAIRALKVDALHFHLDVRRPDIQRTVGVGAPGRRQTLPEVVEDFLTRRLLPGDVDRTDFVRTGRELVDSLEREWAEG